LDQAAEDAVPSAVTKGAIFGVFGAGVGAFVDAHNNREFVAELKKKGEEKAAKIEQDKARITFGDASDDILSGSEV